MLIITPLLLAFMDCLNTHWLMLNVPTVSMSRTLFTPFVLIFSAVARKLPAAPLTRTSTCPNLSTTFCTAVLQLSILETSPYSQWHFAPTSFVTASSFSLFLAIRTTAFAPCATNSLAISRSIPPLEPPVIKQTCPLRSSGENVDMME